MTNGFFDLPGEKRPSGLGRRALEAGLSMTPIVGEAMSLRDASLAGRGLVRSALKGDVPGAARNTGDMLLGIIGAIPGAGLVSRAGKGAAKVVKTIPELVQNQVNLSKDQADRAVEAFQQLAQRQDIPDDIRASTLKRLEKLVELQKRIVDTNIEKEENLAAVTARMSNISSVIEGSALSFRDALLERGLPDRDSLVSFIMTGERGS